MGGWLESLMNTYHETVDRHRNRPFLEAAMSACALVAMSDGAVSLRDRVRVDQVLETLEALQVYDPHEGVDLFNQIVSEIESDPRNGRIKALKLIMEEVNEHRDSAQLLVKIAVAVSKVQGAIPLPEQIEIVSLCSRLMVEPEDTGLYAHDGEVAMPEVVLFPNESA